MLHCSIGVGPNAFATVTLSNSHAAALADPPEPVVPHAALTSGLNPASDPACCCVPVGTRGC